MAKDLSRRTIIGIVFALLIAACASSPQPAEEIDNPETDAVITLFLVRHAEKEAGSDPALTPQGRERAEALAQRLADEGLTEIWSTRTRRTEETAAPVAKAAHIPVQTYDASTLPAFTSWLLDMPGVKLVVGHSNTTDALAALAGADPGPKINEASEFDRLYVIHVDPNGIVTSRIERYGAAWQAAPE